MGEDADSYLPALAIMRKWQWTAHDPDGFPIRLGIDLSEVVSRLAMEGQRSPHMAVLALLCRKQLLAFGHFKWRKYQWGNHFQLEDYNAEVTAKQWQTLLAAIDQEQREIADGGWPFVGVDLQKLELENCPNYEWSFGDNRFSFALCPPETPIHDKAYFEEWFSAWDIDIRFPNQSIETVENEPNQQTIEAPAVGRPLAAWWPDFVAELVAYTVEAGLPPGIGHQGQSEVIKDVCTRLQERGKEEPSRSQIQESVNAVLRRMRSAGN